MSTIFLHIGNCEIDFTMRLLSINRFDDMIDDRRSVVATTIPSTAKQTIKRTLTVNIGCAITDQTVHIKEYCVNDNLLTIKIDNGIELRIKYDTSEELYDKYEIEWMSVESYHYMKDVIETDESSQWYGGPQIAQQTWPLAADTLQHFSPYLPSDTLKIILDFLFFLLNQTFIVLFFVFLNFQECRKIFV